MAYYYYGCNICNGYQKLGYNFSVMVIVLILMFHCFFYRTVCITVLVAYKCFRQFMRNAIHVLWDVTRYTTCEYTLLCVATFKWKTVSCYFHLLNYLGCFKDKVNWNPGHVPSFLENILEEVISDNSVLMI